MTVPQKGQADHLQLGDWNAICSVCGRKYKASDMLKQPGGVGTPWGGGTYVCKRDYRPRQPQDFVRGIPDKMAAPWVQPWPADGQFQRQPVINITEDTDELIVFVNVGSPSSVGVRLVIVVAPNVTLSALALDAVTTTDSEVYFAEEVIVNNSGLLGVVENPDDIPLEIRNFGGGRNINLRFTQQPTTEGANSTISPSITVALVDGDGATITDFVGNIILALGEDYGTPQGLVPGQAVLSGTLTQAAVAGVATFNNLSIDVPGTDYTLVATTDDPENLVTRTSAAFNITGTLVFTQQPTDAGSDEVITPPVTVTLRNGLGATITDYEGDIIVGFATGGNPGGATLGGTLVKTAVAGIATFNDLTVSEEADDYKLVAQPETATGAISSVESNTFDISDLFELIISGDTTNYNVASAFIAAFGAQPPSISLRVTVNSGVVVSATATATAALTWGAGWSGSNTFTLVNNGHIVGKGGAGGQGDDGDGAAGSAGGKAIELSGLTVEITNASGFIWGGGGGGGGGAAFNGTDIGVCDAAGGGGGGGAGAGAGGTAGVSGGIGVFWTLNSESVAGSTPAGALIAQVGGTAGAGAVATSTTNGRNATGGSGGTGGAYGANGVAGSLGTGTVGTSYLVGALGAAGKAINLTGGTANFASGSGSPNVKGAVS